MAHPPRLMRASILSALGASALSPAARAQEVASYDAPKSEAPETIGQGVAACVDPELVFSRDFSQYTGFLRCQDGRLLRDRAASVFARSGDPVTGCTVGSDSGMHSCQLHSDCRARAFGRCEDAGFPVVHGCECVYACRNDDDCRSTEACVDGTLTGRKYPTCVRADCRSNADCESNMCQLSLPTHTVEDYSSPRMACRTPKDSCVSYRDCAGGGDICGGCTFNEATESFRCLPTNDCVITGRPFLVHGEPTLASLVEGGAWIANRPSTPFGLTSKQRQKAGQHWLVCARMEHASVAAFARFALQLMHLGAPPQLLQDTAAAMQDEIKHAKACFALAHRYHEVATSAGPLEVSQALHNELDPASIAMDIFLEGCVGETVAAVEAAIMSEHAQDPVVHDTLNQITHDEHNHALLAWRSLDWILQTLPESHTQAIAAVLHEQVQRLREELAQPKPHAAPEDPEDPELLAHGVPDKAQRHSARQDALASVVLPCAQTLLAKVAAQRTHEVVVLHA